MLGAVLQDADSKTIQSRPQVFETDWQNDIADQGRSQFNLFSTGNHKHVEIVRNNNNNKHVGTVEKNSSTIGIGPPVGVEPTTFSDTGAMP